jgi:hypothetical protein
MSLDEQYTNKNQTNWISSQAILEERMVKYEQECDERLRIEVQAQVTYQSGSSIFNIAAEQVSRARFIANARRGKSKLQSGIGKDA